LSSVLFIDYGPLFELTEGLFKDIEVHFKRVNPKGRSYIIAEEAIYQFLNWEGML